MFTIAVVVIILIDLLLAALVRNMPGNTIGGFLSRWGQTAGAGAILYDIIYITIVIFLALALNKLNQYYDTNKILIPAVLLIYTYITLNAQM